MRTIAKVALFLICPMMLFLIGMVVVGIVNIAIYGADALDGDAGAKFALFLEGVILGGILGLAGIPLALYLSDRLPWLRTDSNDPNTRMDLS